MYARNTKRNSWCFYSSEYSKLINAHDYDKDSLIEQMLQHGVVVVVVVIFDKQVNGTKWCE